MRVKLTKKTVERLAPGAPSPSRPARDIIAWDSEVPGFGLKVTPTGRRSYFVYYRTASGQQRRPKIGDRGVITVDEARQIARQWMANAAAGGHISDERQRKREAGTVAELAERYLREYAEPHKKPRSVQTDRANLENHVLPIIGSKNVKDVTRQDVDRLKVAVRDGQTARRLRAKARGRRIIRGGEGIANRVIALLSKMFSCAQDWGLRDDNPANKIKKYKERRKDRFLDADEVGRLLTSLDVADATQTQSIKATTAIRILLYTGMRYGEVMTMPWKSVDAEHRCFRLADTKTGARIIPYSAQVAGALSALERGQPDALVFEGTKAGSPLSLRRPWYAIRQAAGIDPSASLHTLRHTFASWSVMGGLSLAQVGAMLGHKSAQTTLRYADHATEALRAYNEQTAAGLAALRKTSSNSNAD